MQHPDEIEALLSARRVDIDDHEHLATCCEAHAISEAKLRAVIDTFRPLSESLEIFLTQ